MRYTLVFCFALTLLLGAAPHPGHAQIAVKPLADATKAKRTLPGSAAGLPRLNAPAQEPAPPIAPPFKDVPKSHWAYSSVETLRRIGVLRGEAGKMGKSVGPGAASPAPAP